MLGDTSRSMVVPTTPAKPDPSSARHSGGSGASQELTAAVGAAESSAQTVAWQGSQETGSWAPDRWRNSDDSGGDDSSGGRASSQKQASGMQSGDAPRPNVHSRASKFHSADVKESTHNARKSLRADLVHSEWYHSSKADRLRAFLLGRTVTIIMSVALLIALFLPDMYVIFGGNADLPVDVALALVMFLFFCELVCLSAVDASYLLSFFFFMDFIGTFCMVFDLSFAGVGASHEAPTEISGSDDSFQKNAMLLRATRAAKVGARAGRLSRVLRILQFVPFLSKLKDDKAMNQRTALGSAISTALSNLLATRVASLTIMLVMVIPLFEMLSWPQADYSMRAWTQRLSSLASMGLDSEMTLELGMMVEYYSSRSYGPYKACKGLWDTAEGTFDCQDPISGWDPLLGRPSRGASTYLIHTDSFMVSFNMHEPLQVEAGCSMATMIFVIFIMVFSGMALSSVVTSLAVRPLERMLNTVRHIAITVFKFSAEVNDNDEADPEDISGSSEVKLLEKVVQKLAVIADLQTQRLVEIDEEMRDEDKGILSMMQGKDVVEEAARPRKVSVAIPRNKKVEIVQLTVEEHGMTQDMYNSWNFNPLNLAKLPQCALAVFTIAKFHTSGEGFFGTPERDLTLAAFVSACEAEYQGNPFHNFAHAVDVCHGVAKLMRLISSDGFLSELEQHSLLVSAIAHDLGHPGVNNGFLSEVGHELALQYNDKSPLENMHCAKLYTLVANKELNIFDSLSKEQYKEVRKHCIEVILHTDMTGHMAMVKELQMVYEMNSEIFAPRTTWEEHPQMCETQVFVQPKEKELAMQCILHSADVSNACRAWDVTQAWAMVCLEEFFAQGDREKMLGIPVQFLNDRDKLNRPNSQIGFIEFMIAPFVAAQMQLWPAMREYGSNLASNIERWEELWEKDILPSEEDALKARNRVQAVAQKMQAASARARPSPA